MAAVPEDPEAVSSPAAGKVPSRPVGPGLKTERLHHASQPGRGSPCSPALGPGQHQAVSRHGPGESGEGVLQLLERIVAIEMVRLDPRDDDVPGGKMEEVGPVLTCLHQHELPPAGTTAEAAMAVVLDLPCVPATARPCRPDMSCPSISK